MITNHLEKHKSSVPTVGLGMPVYNGERFLAEAISSILAQSFDDFELIISDNASTDRTAEICRSFMKADHRVKYRRNTVNLGAHPNYNRTFELARGRFFKWVPHDDTLHPDYLGACIRALEAHPNAVACQSHMEYINDLSRAIGVHDGHVVDSDSADPVTRFGAMVLRPHDCYDVMGLFRREALERSMLLPSFHGGDRALLAQLALQGPFIRVESALLRVRDHSGRYTRAQKRPRDRATWHDARNVGRFSFPTWRLYRTYWETVSSAALSRRDRRRARMILGKWWLTNFNSARMAVDALAGIAPDTVASAERIKQAMISPAPGVDELRRSRRR